MAYNDALHRAPQFAWGQRNVAYRLMLCDEMIYRGGKYRVEEFMAHTKCKLAGFGGPRGTNFTSKFLMMAPGIDRCETIGFRCAVDLSPT